MPGVVLQQIEQQVLLQIYRKSLMDDGNMQFWMFILMAMQNNIASNKLGYEVLYTVFKQSLYFGLDPNRSVDEEIKAEINFDQFKYSIVLMAQAVNRNSPKPMEKFLAQLRKGPPSSARDYSSRRPKVDDNIRRILSLNAIKTMGRYLFQLKKIFTAFHHQNQKSSKIQLTWSIIEEENLPINIKSLLRMLRYFCVIPHQLSLKQLQQIIQSSVPPMTHHELTYYRDKGIVEDYERFIQRTNASCTPNPDKQEVEILFVEFIIIILRICLEAGEGPTISKKIQNFLTDKWGILPISGQFTMTPQDLEKAWNKIQGDLRSNKLQIEDAGGGIYSESEEEDQSEMSTAAPWTHNRQGSVSSQLSDYRPGRKTASIDDGDSDEEDDHSFTLEKLKNDLEKNLPPAPPQPVLKKVNPPPYKIPRQIYKPKGTPQINLDDINSGDDEGSNRDEGEDGDVEVFEKTSKDPNAPVKLPYKVAQKIHTVDNSPAKKHARTLSQNLTFSNGKKMAGYASVAPQIIEEVLFPPTTQVRQIHDLIESAMDFMYSTKKDFLKARHHFREAFEMWKREQSIVKPQIRIFFHLIIGSSFDLEGNPLEALKEISRTMKIKLPYNHPDQAFPYCFYGIIFYKMMEIDLAYRCLNVARDVREERSGADTADTATIYNNLGCCMYSLQRNAEALAYFNLAQAIFNLELGAHHERTLISLYNINLTKKTAVNMEPEYKPLFSFAVEGLKKDGKKKKKKGKKKKK